MTWPASISQLNMSTYSDTQLVSLSINSIDVFSLKGAQKNASHVFDAQMRVMNIAFKILLSSVGRKAINHRASTLKVITFPIAWIRCYTTRRTISTTLSRLLFITGSSDFNNFLLIFATSDTYQVLKRTIRFTPVIEGGTNRRIQTAYIQ